MPNLGFVGVGTGRCGTVFLARYLTSIGVPCGHESVFDRGGIAEARVLLRDGRRRSSLVGGNSWLPPDAPVRAESSYMAAPYLDDPLLDGAAVIHLVRNPMDVLSSFHHSLRYFGDVANLESYQRFIFGHLKRLYAPMHPLERCCVYIVEWNRLIERKSAGKRRLLHRIEDDPAAIRDFVAAPDHDPGGVFGDTRANSQPRPDCTLAEIPAGRARDEFVAFARSLGYPVA